MARDLDKMLRDRGENKGITPRQAWEDGVFDEILEFRVKDKNGFQVFFSDKVDEVFEYFVEVGVEKFIPWTSFKINDKWGMALGWEFKFNRKKTRKGNIPSSMRSKNDKKHKKIKGQKNYRRW